MITKSNLLSALIATLLGWFLIFTGHERQAVFYAFITYAVLYYILGRVKLFVARGNDGGVYPGDPDNDLDRR